MVCFILCGSCLFIISGLVMCVSEFVVFVGVCFVIFKGDVVY